MKLLFRHLTPLLFASLPFAAQAAGGSQTLVKLQTNHGEITLQLDAVKAPESAANFIRYVESGFYDGTIFHRVIENFMIQGGGFDEAFKQKNTEAPIQNEADNGLSNKRGSIAMARTGDPHSATAQFFINTKDNDFLDYRDKTMQDWGYTVFGEVIEGMEIVDAIRKVKTTMRGGHQDVPADLVVIEKATVVQ